MTAPPLVSVVMCAWKPRADWLHEAVASELADDGELERQAGAGLVKVLMTGRHDVKLVTIDPTLLSEDKDMLEDLVAAAMNDAVRKVEALSQEKMAGMSAGLGLPPGFKLPF